MLLNRSFLLPLAFSAAIPAASQTGGRTVHEVTVFAEAWGEGVFNSLNLEKTFTTPSLVSYHLRMGFGYWRKADVNCYTLPVDMALSVGRSVKLEVSLGATPFALAADQALASSTLAPTFGLHLRFQGPKGGLFLRAGALIAPMSGLRKLPGGDDLPEADDWGWNPGVGLGFTF